MELMKWSKFKELFEKLGYTSQSDNVLQSMYYFYLNDKTKTGFAAILLEGGQDYEKTYLSVIFSQVLGHCHDTEYIYKQCVGQIDSDGKKISSPSADKAIAEEVLTRAINSANAGKKVVLTINELDKASEIFDFYLLDFFIDSRLYLSDNKILSLTEEGKKNIYVILTKSNGRNLLDSLLRRCKVIKLPPLMDHKTLIKTIGKN